MTIIDGTGLRMPTAGIYSIDPERSVIRFRTRAMFGLLSVPGTFRIAHGKVLVASTPETSAIEAEVRADSFDSGNDERDDHVRSTDFLDAGVHRTFGFVSERLEVVGGRAMMHGRLTVRAITRPVGLRLDTLDASNGRLVAGATARIDRYEFGITRSKGMAARYISLAIEVVANR